MSDAPDPGQSAADKPPRERLAKGQEVSLGCGTLILIALIVLIFGRSGTGNLEREIRGLRTEIVELKKAVDAQTGEIRALQDKVNKLKGKE